MELPLSEQGAAFRNEVRAFIEENNRQAMRVADPETYLTNEQVLLWRRILPRKGSIAPPWETGYGGPGSKSSTEPNAAGRSFS